MDQERRWSERFARIGAQVTKFGQKLIAATREVIEDIRTGNYSLMVPVVSVKQSPLNPARWCCGLQCGHDVWVTAKCRPTRKMLACERCREDDRDAADRQ